MMSSDWTICFFPMAVITRLVRVIRVPPKGLYLVFWIARINRAMTMSG